jgi:hypothetical protein
MQSVWKFVVDEGPVLIPKNAKILAIHEQYPSICIWALVDPFAEKELRDFVVISTGSHFAQFGPYIGTVFTRGDLVYHVFER